MGEMLGISVMEMNQVVQSFQNNISHLTMVLGIHVKISKSLYAIFQYDKLDMNVYEL